MLINKNEHFTLKLFFTGILDDDFKFNSRIKGITEISKRKNNINFVRLLTTAITWYVGGLTGITVYSLVTYSTIPIEIVLVALGAPSLILIIVLFRKK